MAEDLRIPQFGAEARDYGFIDGIVESFAQVVPRRRRPAGLGLGPAEVAA